VIVFLGAMFCWTFFSFAPSVPPNPFKWIEFLTMSLYIFDHNQFLDKVPQALSFICRYVKEDMKTWRHVKFQPHWEQCMLCSWKITKKITNFGWKNKYIEMALTLKWFSLWLYSKCTSKNPLNNVMYESIWLLYWLCNFLVINMNTHYAHPINMMHLIICMQLQHPLHNFDCNFEGNVLKHHSKMVCYWKTLWILLKDTYWTRHATRSFVAWTLFLLSTSYYMSQDV
jgi:hypothetical protein